MWCSAGQRERGGVQHACTPSCSCHHLSGTHNSALFTNADACYIKLHGLYSVADFKWVMFHQFTQLVPQRYKLTYSRTVAVLQQDDFLVSRIAMEEGVARSYLDNDFIVLSKDDPNVGVPDFAHGGCCYARHCTHVQQVAITTLSIHMCMHRAHRAFSHYDWESECRCCAKASPT